MKVEKRIGEAEVAGQLGGAHNNHNAYSTCMKLSKNKLSNFFNPQASPLRFNLKYNLVTISPFQNPVRTQ